MKDEITKREKKYEECADILQSVHDSIILVLALGQLPDDKSALEIVKESIKAYEEYENLSPVERAIIEADSDSMVAEIEALTGLEVLDNRKEHTAHTNATTLDQTTAKSKKVLLN